MAMENHVGEALAESFRQVLSLQVNHSRQLEQLGWVAGSEWPAGSPYLRRLIPPVQAI
jgi:hypothetical protein